jgi:hypothetical protein
MIWRSVSTKTVPAMPTWAALKPMDIDQALGISTKGPSLLFYDVEEIADGIGR